jgi:hypothetical protein
MARLQYCAGHWRLVFAGALASAVAATQAAPLNPQAEVRSAIGSVLDARIDAGPLDRVSSDGECFGWIPDSIDPPGIELALTVIEVRGRRTLKLESRDPIAAPRVRLTLTVGCVPATRVAQTLDLALKPVAKIVPAPTPPATLADTKRFADPGMAVVTRPGDSLASLARLIYPMDAARQTQFIAALRNHNPELVSLGVDDAMPSGSRIVFPDLKDLSGIAPQQTLTQSALSQPAKPGPRVASRPAKESPVATPSPSAKPRAKPSTPDAPAASLAPAKPIEPSPQTRVAGTPQMLRLSTPEIDTSRSARVSPEQRTAIRQRRLLLDADDQMAAILSLQEAVRQLETRLQVLSAESSAKGKAAGQPPVERDSIQLKQAQQVAPAPAKPAPVAEPAAAAPPAAPAAQVEVKPIAPAPVQAIPPKLAAAPPSPPPADTSSGAWWTDPLALGVAAVSLVGLLATWLWTRRGSKAKPAKPVLAPVARQPAAPAFEEPEVDESAPLDVPAGPPTVAPQMAETVRIAAHPLPVEVSLNGETNDQSTERFDLDPTPAASLDLALDDRPDEDRVRRLQYMYERFPELMSRTVSIDDADSVINAARLYYEEGQADRACELLTFGVEERPQEVRFWLAQFEIFRLENRVADFSELAAKFHVLFSYAPSWPKVRHIGHELDPANPLFAAGRDVLAGDAHFDPVVENWLNAPMDFTADALLSDLRREMFDQFNVDRSDFDTLPTRMGAHR